MELKIQATLKMKYKVRVLHLTNKCSDVSLFLFLGFDLQQNSPLRKKKKINQS